MVDFEDSSSCEPQGFLKLTKERGQKERNPVVYLPKFRVSLSNGGYLVLEQTEALVSIDVNGGQCMLGHGTSQEKAILDVNLAAAKQIAREIRLRDIGGIIVVDFIDKRPDGISEDDDDEEDDEDDEEESGEEDDDDDDDEGDEERGSAKSNAAQTKKAAAAMCVGMGSFCDPLEAQGLAHFLEHMLFMGSAEFPDENEVFLAIYYFVDTLFRKIPIQFQFYEYPRVLN